MLVNKQTLLQVLDQMRKCIEADDSFQGTITYDFMHGHDVTDDKNIELTATLRSGNSQGQGSTSIIEPHSVKL